MSGPGRLCLLAMATLAGGCILEDNPDFVESTTGTTGPVPTGGTLVPTSTSNGTVDTTQGPLTSTTSTTGTDSSSSSSSDTGEPPMMGCDDPSVCPTYHVGPASGTCPHDDGGPTNACDFVGTGGLRDAVSAVEASGTGGLVILYDGGAVASYAGGIDVPGETTIRGATGQSSDSVRVHSQDTAGTVRLRADGVHLQGFTLACRAGCEWAVTVRSDLETEGTETGYHLIENLLMVATQPENVGANSIATVLQSLGHETIVRNNHIWGYFEGGLDLRHASDSIFSHNTVLYYQSVEGAPGVDARSSSGLEISNNVFASLTDTSETFVLADASTSALVVAGNAVEGYAAELSGLEPSAPEVTAVENTLDPLELESPEDPLVLSNSGLRTSDLGTAEGTSLDGVPLDPMDLQLPGAYQTRSAQPTPRRDVIRVGDGTCGGSACDLTKATDNELQRAVWSVWPGGTVEVHPSVTPYAGPVVISWPITLRGATGLPDDVIVQTQIEDSILSADGQWAGKDAVVDLTHDMDQPAVVEQLTIRAGSGEVGLFHEGRRDGALNGRHEIRQVVLRDDGAVAGALADMALTIGNQVWVHDVLVHGGYDTCLRFGPRPDESAQTPATTAYVHHFTCRLTESSSGDPLAVFEVAAVEQAVIADVVVELSETGPLFRAQRRSAGDGGMTALDVPASFTAHSIAARGFGVQFDGFADPDGVYTLTNVDTVGIMEPLFIDASDSHLEAGALGIDGGVDPATLEPGLSLQTSLDGIDRSGLAVDRGCYEQGL